MAAKLLAWACCHRWKLAGTLLVAVVSTNSFLRGVSFAVDSVEGNVLLVRKSPSLIRRASIEAPPIQQEEEVLKVRGNVVYTRKTLTEGPRFRPGRQFYDSSEIYFEVKQRFNTPVYVLGWKPIVNKHRCPNGSEVELIHHMNILGKAEVDFQKMFSGGGPRIRFGGDEGEVKIVASYDRGAREYRLPKGYGLSFSPHFTRLVLEYHLLLPHCWDFTKEPVVETSGFDLYITREKPRHIASLVGFTDEDLHVDKNQGLVEQTTVLNPGRLAQYFSASGAEGLDGSSGSLAGGERPSGSDHLEILAVHLHTHDIAQSKSVEVIDKNGHCRFRSQREQAGYGATQSMKNLADKGWPRLLVESGESLHFKCRYDTNTFQQTLIDGTSWGEEMCSVLMVVTSAKMDTSGGATNSILSEAGGFLKRLGRELLRLASPWPR